MSNLTACQPGWVAVFEQTDGVDRPRGYSTEPVACWISIDRPHQPPEVHPVCAMGGDVCDATQADNYIGVVGPNNDPKKLYDAYCASIKKTA